MLPKLHAHPRLAAAWERGHDAAYRSTGHNRLGPSYDDKGDHNDNSHHRT
jgi:hypothetical protein